jgi:hypothetical protein
MLATVINAVIHHDPVEPGREFRFAFEFLRVAPDLQKNLLSQILNIITITNISVDSTENSLLIFMNQLLKSLLITAGHEFNYMLIGVFFPFDSSHDYARGIFLLFLT